MQEVAARLTDGVPDDPLERTPDQQAAWLLAQLLSWHRREAKVAFWDFFNRLGMDVAELAADKQALGPLEVVGPIGEPWKPSAKAKYARQTWRYRYAPQDYDIGSDLYDPALYRQQPDAKWSAWKVRAEVRGSRRQAVDRRPGVAGGHRPAASGGVGPPQHLRRQGAARGTPPPGRVGRGAWDRRARPVARGARRAPSAPAIGRPGRRSDPLQQPGETGLDAACRIGRGDGPRCPRHPGPAGLGKDLHRRPHGGPAAWRRAGRSGISANSHKVIGNFLREHRGCRCRSRRADPMHPEGHRGRAGRRRRPGDDHEGQHARRGTGSRTTSTTSLPAPSGCGRRPRAMGCSTSCSSTRRARCRSPTCSPCRAPRARSSCSAIRSSSISRSRAPIRPARTDRRWRTCSASTTPCPTDLGLFLEHTWRLHPDITEFTSTAFYEGKLQSRENLGRQFLHGPAPMVGAGVATVVRRPRRQRVRVARGGAAGRGRRARPRRERIKLDRQARRGPPASLRGRPRRGAVQRAGRRHPARAARGARGHRRQVPGPGGAGEHLLDDLQLAGGRPARHGLPLLAEPPQRRDLAGPMRGGRRRHARAPSRPRPHAGADAARQRPVPVRRDGDRELQALRDSAR